MSGAEVIGIISGVIAIIHATAKVYKAVTNASDLPEAFHDVATRLPLVCKTLQTISRSLNNAILNEECYNTIKPILQQYENRSTQLQKIFNHVIPQTDTSRMERYALTALTWGKRDTVETLIKGILEDIQLLTSNRVAELPTETDLTAVIQKAIEEVAGITASLPDGIHVLCQTGC